MELKKLRKVIWAVDAFEESTAIQQNSVQTLKTLSNIGAQESEFKIEPVFVLSPDQLNLPRDYAGHLIDHYEPAAKKALNQRLKQIKLPNLTEPRILIHRQYSLRSLAQHFLNYAEESQADLIVVGTHSRTGLSKFLLGSFAEALLTTSPIPVLVTGQTGKSESRFDRILYPSELLGEPSQSTFPKALSIAKQFNAQMTLLHTLPRLMEPAFQSGVYLLGGGWIPPLRFSEKEEEKQRKAAEAWIRFGNENEVKVDLIIDVDSHSVVDSVIKHTVSTNADLITIETQRGPITAALLGSITRQVTRLASCPVWVLRSDSSS